jgi:hypothetical protein
MTVFRVGGWALTAVMLAGMANRAEAQIMLGGGSVRYSYRGPFGGRVNVVQGPFGGGAVSVRGPFGGRVNVVRPPVVGVFPPVLGVPPVVGVVPPVLGFPPVAGATGPFGGVPGPIGVNRPYTAACLSRIPPGYGTLMIGGVAYYCTPALPPGCQPAVVGGVNYFVNGGVFYQPYFYQGQTVYVVVER